MKFPLNLSLKAKFMVLCVFSILGAGAAGYFALLRSEPPTNLLPPFDQTSKALSKTLNERYVKVLTDVQSIALNPVFEGDVQKVAKTLTSYADLFSDYEILSFVDTHGAVLATSSPEENEHPAFSSDEDFEKALKSKDVVFANQGIYVRINNSKDETLGVLYAQVSNKWLEKEVKAALDQLIEVGVRTASIQVINKAGEVVAGTPVGEDSIQEAFTAVYPIAKIGWNVEVKAERNELVTIRRHPHRFFLTSLLTLFFVASVLAWILANRFTKQVWTVVGQMSEMVSLLQRTSEGSASELPKLEETLKKIEQSLRALEEQTTQANLVALNASLEAARVGDAGKGFGVLAEEVRNLATKGASSVKEVYPQIMQNSLETLQRLQELERSPNPILVAQSERLESLIRELNLILNGKGELPKKPAIPPNQGPWQGLRIIEGGKSAPDAPSKDAIGSSKS